MHDFLNVSVTFNKVLYNFLNVSVTFKFKKYIKILDKILINKIFLK